MAWWTRNRAEKAPETFDAATGMVIKTTDPDGAKAASFDGSFLPILAQYGTGFPGGHYSAIYRRQPAVRSVVNFLARNVAQLNLKTYARVGDTDRIELDAHPMSILFRTPNPDTTKYRLFRDLVSDVAIEDVAYWAKIRQPTTGAVAAIVRIPYSKLITEYLPDTNEVIYRDSLGRIIPRRDLVIFPGYHPDGNPWGVSPMETLRRVLEEDWAATENRRYMWKNAARREGLIKRPLDAPTWSADAAARFRADWEATHSGAANAGRTPILEDGMDWVGDSFSPQEAEYIEGRRLTAEEVARAYGIEPRLLGITSAGGDANANVESFHRQLYQDVLGPLLTSIEQEIELQLLPDVDRGNNGNGRVYVEFSLADKLKASFEEEMRVLVTAAGVPIVSRNEARARLNLPRLEEDDNADRFDVPVTPLNVLEGGQPAPTVPTADPSTPPPAGSPPAAAAALPRAKARVPRAAQRRRQIAADAYAVLFRRYFRDYENAYLAQQGKTIPKALNGTHWDGKLATLLYSAGVNLANETGKIAATQIRGVYSEEQTLNYLAETARVSARNINKTTIAQLAGLEDPEDVIHIFDVAKGSRSTRLGLSTATGIINFARQEAAKQSQVADGRERTKTWIVTSQNSRHPEMDGETVAMSEDFSNGLAWPGASDGETDEIAGCQCLLDMQ